jgi:hypothetical protein
MVVFPNPKCSARRFHQVTGISYDSVEGKFFDLEFDREKAQLVVHYNSMTYHFTVDLEWIGECFIDVNTLLSRV